MPDVTPVYHPDVADYLDTVVQSDPNGPRLLDWLATCSDLDRATTTLLLRGRAGAGKSMLAEALGQIFGGRSDFSKVMGRFNAEMLDSALIHLEEGVDDLRGPVANRFRAIVGGTSISIEQKGIDPVTVIGNYRVIVTSNQPQPIPVSNSVNLDDFRAIAMRVLPLYLGDGPANFLEDNGGRNFTDDWVERDVGTHKVPGKLSEHIRWLQENHAATDYGHRFLVPAEVSNWHARNLLQGVLRDVLVASGHALLIEDDTVIPYQEGVWIQASPSAGPRVTRVVNKWANANHETQAILHAIKSGLCEYPPKRINGKVYYPLPTDLVLALAEPEDPEVFVEEQVVFERMKLRLVS